MTCRSPRPSPSRALAALAASAVALAGCASAGPFALGPAPAGPPPSARLEATLAALEPLDAAAFAPVEALADLGPVAEELGRFWRAFFRPEASPSRSGALRLGARPAEAGAPDLVRSELDLAVARVEVLDAPGFALVRVADPGVDVADGAAAQVLVRRLLAVGRTWDVALPDRLAEGTWYTGVPGAEPGAGGTLRDPIDVRVLGGRLEILALKRGPETERDGGVWFSPALRARLAAAPR